MKNFLKIFFSIATVIVLSLPVFAQPDYSVLRQKGIDFYNAGKYKDAIQTFTSIPKNEHNLEMVICLANSYESIGDVRSAVILLESLNKESLPEL